MGWWDAAAGWCCAPTGGFCFLDKGPLWGFKQIEIPLEQVSSVAHRTGLVYGQLKILGTGIGETVVKRMGKDAALGFARAVQASRREHLANDQREKAGREPRWSRRVHTVGPVGWTAGFWTRGRKITAGLIAVIAVIRSVSGGGSETGRAAASQTAQHAGADPTGARG